MHRHRALLLIYQYKASAIGGLFGEQPYKLPVLGEACHKVPHHGRAGPFPCAGLNIGADGIFKSILERAPFLLGNGPQGSQKIGVGLAGEFLPWFSHNSHHS